MALQTVQVSVAAMQNLMIVEFVIQVMKLNRNFHMVIVTVEAFQMVMLKKIIVMIVIVE